MKRKLAQSLRIRNPDFPVNVDLLPVLSLQAQLDAKQELYGLTAHVSEGRSKIEDKKHVSDLNFEVKTIPGTSTRTVVEWGSTEPKDETRVTQYELWEEIRAQLGVPEAVIQTRGSINDIPPKLADRSIFEGADEIYSSDIAYGNRAPALRRRLRLHVANPYEMIKYDLLTRNIISSAQHPALRRIRSILSTDCLKPNNDKGQDHLFLIGQPLQRGLRGNKFWKDTAIPQRKYLEFNSHQIELILYRLDTQSDKLMAF